MSVHTLVMPASATTMSRRPKHSTRAAMACSTAAASLPSQSTTAGAHTVIEQGTPAVGLGDQESQPEQKRPALPRRRQPQRLRMRTPLLSYLLQE